MGRKHGLSQRVFDKKSRFVSSCRRLRMYKSSKDLADRLMDSFNDTVALRIVSRNRTRLDTSMVQEELKVMASKL